MTTVHSIQVVVAYDFTPTAEVALQRALDVACRAPEHVLHVIAVLDPRRGLTAVPTREVDYTYAERVQERITAQITQLLREKPRASEVELYVHARIGRPADEILGLARDVGAELVFIGCHGLTGVERYLLGSVSERVVREARCPVMVARAKTYDDVALAHVFKYEHALRPYKAPHRYTYVDRVPMRPADWPIS